MAALGVRLTNKPVLIVMGVSGAGKSTLGRALADRLHMPFQEGDDLHPAANVAKMRAGIPLTDADRAPWLTAVADWIDQRIGAGEGGVVTCSALKAAYRRTLTEGRPATRLVFLDGAPELIGQRLAHRSGHYMPASLLDSQLATLERPGPDEDAIVVSIDQPIADQVRQAVSELTDRAII